MIYMLDTNICIYIIKNNPLSYFERFELLSVTNIIAISSIVLSELQYGVECSNKKQQSQTNLDLLASKLKILPYTNACAIHYGVIKSFLKAQGQLIGGNDLLIAAHAIAEKAVLITNNTKEFLRVPGLQVENWAK